VQSVLFRFANSVHSPIYKQVLLQADQDGGQNDNKP